jgi:hypothetical protein
MLAVSSSLAHGDPVSDSVAATKAALRATPFSNEPDYIVDNPNPAAAIPDAGTSTDISTVQNNAVDDLTRDGLVTINNTLPSDVTGAVSVFTAAASVTLKVQELTSAANYASTQGYPAYSNFRFVPETWNGVQVSGTSAHAIVWGHEDFYRFGAWDSSDRIQYDLTLSLESGRWKVVNASSAHLSGLPSGGVVQP